MCIHSWKRSLSFRNCCKKESTDFSHKKKRVDKIGGDGGGGGGCGMRRRGGGVVCFKIGVSLTFHPYHF